MENSRAREEEKRKADAEKYKQQCEKKAKENKKSRVNEAVYTITAYCPCKRCCGKTNGITSTGVKAKEGRTVAVDPRKIPYGSKIIIDGHTYIAEDCGGAIKGNRIDMFFNTHQKALNYGKQRKKVKIIK